MTWRKYVLPLAIAICATAPAVVWAANTQQVAGAATDEAAISQFDIAIAKYLALRKSLLEEVPGPTPESSAPKLVHDSDALAAAIQRARREARAGDLFVAPVSLVIKRRVVETVQRDHLIPVLAGIDDEQRGPAKPSIHMRFPAASPLATMPPSLLAALPVLPNELEYRIIGNFLILRDREAALILDIIPAAVPRQQF